jgi:hypothetical protein
MARRQPLQRDLQLKCQPGSPRETGIVVSIRAEWGERITGVVYQWDFEPPRTFVDVAARHTMYDDDRAIQDAHLRTLSEIIKSGDNLE